MLLPVVLFASLSLVQQIPASSQAPSPAEAEVPAATATLPTVSGRQPVSDTTPVCRTEPVTGSRFGRRVCRSAVQTDEDRAASREMLRQMQGARVPPSG